MPKGLVVGLSCWERLLYFYIMSLFPAISLDLSEFWDAWYWYGVWNCEPIYICGQVNLIVVCNKPYAWSTCLLTRTEWRFSQKRNVADVEIDIKQEVEDNLNQDQNIVRSPPAGTKEKPDYTVSIDLEQARQVFEANSSSPRSGRSSRCEYIMCYEHYLLR